jgi:hypothetical protein
MGDSAGQYTLESRRGVDDLPTASSLDPSPMAHLPVPRPVNRYDYVKQKCAGRRVLDLGAYDETEVDRSQHRTWRWLHSEIADVAEEVLGVDASDRLRASGGTRTPLGTRIVYGTVEYLDEIVADFQPDVVVAGELIEHTQDTLGWLARLARLAPGVSLIATTPNTTSILNVILGLLRRESAHPDHLHVYSYRTLRTLADRVPMYDISITPYYYNRHLFYSRLPRVAAPIVTMVDVLCLRPVQYLFPLLATGLVLEGTLGPPAARSNPRA